MGVSGVEADGVFHHLSPKAGEQGASEGRRGGHHRWNREMEFALCLVYVLLRPHQVKVAPALAKLVSSFSPRVKCWSHLEAPPRHILTQCVTAPWAHLNPHRTSRPGEWDPGASEGSVALGIQPCPLAAFPEHFLWGRPWVVSSGSLVVSRAPRGWGMIMGPSLQTGKLRLCCVSSLVPASAPRKDRK